MKPMTKTLFGVGVALAIGGTVLVGAAGADGRGGSKDHDGHGMGVFSDTMKMLDAVDADRDGKLTQAEVEAARNERNAVLATYDTDGDGNLDLEEFSRLWHETMRPFTVRAFQALDTDGDAFISPTEYERSFADMFHGLDQDDDGSFSVHHASEHDDDDEHDGDDDDHDEDDHDDE